MTDLYSVAPNTPVLAADINQFKSMLQGGSGYSTSWLMIAAPASNFIIRLADAVGTNKLSVQNSAAAELWSVNSSGVMTLTGTFSPAALILPNSATPGQTAEGSIAWDTDDDVLTVGTGSATKRLGLTRGAGFSATATAELVYDTTAAAFKVWDGSTSRNIGTAFKYKTATQTFTTTTTYADVTASSGSFAFVIAASEVWAAEYWIPLTFGGTGGAKFQLTGPSAPTLVDITGILETGAITDGTGATKLFTAVTAFSSDISSAASAAPNTSITSYNNAAPGSFIHIRAHIANGANAGTVTLQAAQNNASTTTTLGIGSYMRAERIG